MNILIVEDYKEWRLALMDYLADSGHHVGGLDRLATMQEYLQSPDQHSPDILILDVGLPDGDGMSTLPDLRRRWPMLGIVILTGHVGLQERISGLTQGADYFLTKPVKLSELGATLAALGRRLVTRDKQPAPPDEDWCLLPGSRKVQAPGGQHIHLTEAEFRVLHRLACSPHLPVPRKDLVTSLGGHPDLYDPHRLEVLIHRLRSKLSPSGIKPLSILSAYGIGYVCTTPVHISGDPVLT